MAEDITNPFSQIMGALTGGSKGESGVRKDNYKGKVKPTLTPAERKRYENIFTIMKDVLSPKAEARDIAKTPAAAIGGTAQMQAVASKDKGDKKGLGPAGILGALALGAAGIGAAIATLLDNVQASFDDIVGSVLKFGGEIASDIGSLPAMALKLAKFLPLKKLKFIPLLGPLINFGMAYNSFNKGDIPRGLFELVSGVAGLFPTVGTAVSIGMDAILYMYDSEQEANAAAGKPPESFGDFIVRKTKELGMFLFTKLKDGKIPFLSGLFRFGEGISYMAMGDFKQGLEAWADIIPAFFGQSGNPAFLQAFDAFITMVGEGGSSMYEKGKSIAGDAFGWLKNLFGEIGSVLSSAFNGMLDWISNIASKGKAVIYNSLPDWAQELWTGSTGYDPEAEAKEKSRLAEQRRMMDARAAARKPYIDRAKKRLGDNWRKNMLEGESGLDYVNRQIRIEKEREYKGPYMSAKEPGIEDGLIYNNGRVTRFDNQDDILAAKSGGPIDKMLNTNSKVMTELNAINQNQLNVLMQIRDGIRALSSNKSSNGPTDITFEPSTLTQEFYAV